MSACAVPGVPQFKLESDTYETWCLKSGLTPRTFRGSATVVAAMLPEIFPADVWERVKAITFPIGSEGHMQHVLQQPIEKQAVALREPAKLMFRDAMVAFDWKPSWRSNDGK